MLGKYASQKANGASKSKVKVIAILQSQKGPIKCLVEMIK
jgi:hypothetical protein